MDKTLVIGVRNPTDLIEHRGRDDTAWWNEVPENYTEFPNGTVRILRPADLGDVGREIDVAAAEDGIAVVTYSTLPGLGRILSQNGDTPSEEPQAPSPQRLVQRRITVAKETPPEPAPSNGPEIVLLNIEPGRMPPQILSTGRFLNVDVTRTPKFTAMPVTARRVYLAVRDGQEWLARKMEALAQAVGATFVVVAGDTPALLKRLQLDLSKPAANPTPDTPERQNDPQDQEDKKDSKTESTPRQERGNRMSRGMSPTSVPSLVLVYLEAKGKTINDVTADELFAVVRKKKPSIRKTSIYQAMSKIRKKGWGPKVSGRKTKPEAGADQASAGATVKRGPGRPRNDQSQDGGRVTLKGVIRTLKALFGEVPRLQKENERLRKRNTELEEGAEQFRAPGKLFAAKRGRKAKA